MLAVWSKPNYQVFAGSADFDFEAQRADACGRKTSCTRDGQTLATLELVGSPLFLLLRQDEILSDLYQGCSFAESQAQLILTCRLRGRQRRLRSPRGFARVGLIGPERPLFRPTRYRPYPPYPLPATRRSTTEYLIAQTPRRTLVLR